MSDAFPLGKTYDHDDDFKARARAHQARFRAETLCVDCAEYGNRLLREDGERLLAYYDGCGVREAKVARYPEYSSTRDGDLLRSEHIPFNLFGPMIGRPALARDLVRRGLGVDCEEVQEVVIEWAPPDKNVYLGDATAFDTMIRCTDAGGRSHVLGIEVKYTEGAYPVGTTEKRRIDDPDSSYWTTAERSGVFVDPRDPALASDGLRQFWRNHLLGLSMVLRGDVDRFTALVVYPAGNPHCAEAIPRYRAMLKDEARDGFRGVTFEDFVGAIDGDPDVRRWREYLVGRYLV